MAEKIVEVDGKRYMKVQKGKYFDKKKNKKMRRHHPVRWILISAFCLLIVAPVGFVFGAFYVPKATNLPDTYSKFEENLNNAISMSLATLGEGKGEFKLTIDKNFLNSSLTYAKNQYIDSTGAGNYIDNFYCDINDNHYNFYVDAHASFFQTKIGLLTTLEVDDDLFTFNIDNVLLGRLPIKNIATSILPQFISEDDINKILAKFLRAEISLKDMKITYKRSYFTEDIGKILGIYNEDGTITTNPMGPYASLLLSLYNQVKTKPDFDNGITFGMDFKQLEGFVKQSGKEEKYVTIDDPLIIDSYETKFKDKKDFVIDCLNKGLVSEKTDELKKIIGCDYLFKFMLDGASSKSDIFSPDLKNAIVAKEKIENINQYVGVYKELVGESTTPTYKKGFCDKLVDELNNSTSRYNYTSKIETTETAIVEMISTLEKGEAATFGSLGEDLLSDYLRYSLGTNFMFCFPLKINNEYTMPTIYFKDFSCNLKEVTVNKEEEGSIKPVSYPISIVGIMDIEGFELPFTILCKLDVNSANRKVLIKPDRYFIGNAELTSVGEILMSFLTASFSDSPTDIFSYSKDNGFMINFASFKVQSPSEQEVPEYITTINKIITGETSGIDFKAELGIDTTTNLGKLIFSFKKS